MKTTRPLLLALALLAGCSTPPDYFHTLRPAAASTAPMTVPTSARDASRVLAIGPVTVPDALGRDEWLVRTGDTGARVYDHQLWTQGLGADVAQSLVDYLNRGLLVDGLWADAGPTGSGSGADLEHPAALRVRVQVLRFDTVLVPAPAVGDQVRWTIECLPSDAALGPVEAGRYRVVRTAVRDAAGPAPAADASVDPAQQPFDRVARAHSETVRLVADDIAAALRASADERARTCVTGH
jgi:uncharacterized lipoprotein YmbA